MESNNSASFKIGQRVVAMTTITWTIGNFEDYPLIVRVGDKATIMAIDLENEQIELKWDHDEHPKIKKCLAFREAQKRIKLL